MISLIGIQTLTICKPICSTDLGADTDQIIYAGYSTRGNAAVVGLPLGAMLGSSVKRDSQGRPLIDSSGNYATSYDTNYNTKFYW